MICLRQHALVFAPPELCFDLARSVDLHEASSRLIEGRAVAGRTSGLSALHDSTTWSARFFGLRFRLTTQITRFERPHCFHDTMREGLLAHFGHRYAFGLVNTRQTLVTDEFFFESPGEVVGAAFDSLVLKGRMQAVAHARMAYIKRIAESQMWRRFLRAELSFS